MAFSVQPLSQKKNRQVSLSIQDLSEWGATVTYCIALPEYASAESVDEVGKVKWRCLECPVEMPWHDTVVTCRWVSGLRLDGLCELSCEVGRGWAKEHSVGESVKVRHVGTNVAQTLGFIAYIMDVPESGYEVRAAPDVS